MFTDTIIICSYCLFILEKPFATPSGKPSRKTYATHNEKPFAVASHGARCSERSQERAQINQRDEKRFVDCRICRIQEQVSRIRNQWDTRAD